ncbi:MAG: KilA-N domain-containing protein [Bacteroidetes bacterium]|nr:KilA-N domain-containing protein [Bacteroidota bacterium]
MSKIKVKGHDISIIKFQNEDYICLTDMLRSKEGDFFITDWLRNRNTLEFLSIWESVNNPTFNYGEFAAIKSRAGLNSFKVSVKEWVARTNATGIIAKTGRYGGTYAHRDIAFEFGSWISPEFKLYLIKEFQRLKDRESKAHNQKWHYGRFLSKINYRLHTDAIQESLIERFQLTPAQAKIIYSDEAELLNMAVFGITSVEWRRQHPKETKLGQNIRDLANLYQLTVLANLESYNSILIQQGVPAGVRYDALCAAAKQQLDALNKLKHIAPVDSPMWNENKEGDEDAGALVASPDN